LNSLFFSNQARILSEPLLKQYAANSKKGVVGNKGTKTPITPILANMLPKIFHIGLLIFDSRLFILLIVKLNIEILNRKNRLIGNAMDVIHVLLADI